MTRSTFFSGRFADYGENPNFDLDDRLESTRASSIMEMACSHFLSLVGIELDYYGCDQSDNTFMVDKIVFKVLEDPDDGYRSCLGTMDYTKLHRDRPTSIFYKQPITKVKIVAFSEDEGDEEDKYGNDGEKYGYRLIDVEDDHCWLEFGTNHYDSYYPFFIFTHTPKERK